MSLKYLQKIIAVLIITIVTPLCAESPDFVSVAKKAIPAVASIKVELRRPIAKKYYSSPFEEEETPESFQDEFWRRFFNSSKKTQEKEPNPIEVGQGSGFLVTPDGYILTNNHIVQDASKILVTLINGREYEAKVIGNDSATDVALIKIDGEGLPFLSLGNSSALDVGQWVAAVGNPLGLNATMTIGIISAIDRTNLGLTQIEDFIQTDAAINRGNSGGPLLNLSGEVVGINTAIATQTGGYMGIGFAIPSNLAANIMDQLIKNGSFIRGYMGVHLQQIDHDLATAFGLEEVKGALISQVAKNSPADKAGLKSGDIILKYNGQEVKNVAELRNKMSLMKPTENALLAIKRQDKILDIGLIVATHPKSEITADIKDLGSFGVQVKELTGDLARSLGYADEKGVIVAVVDQGSSAAMAGIKRGSLILSVNQKDIMTPSEFYNAVKNSDPKKPLLLLIRQGEVNQYISLKMN